MLKLILGILQLVVIVSVGNIPIPPIQPIAPESETSVSTLYVTDCIEAESGNWEEIQILINCVFGEYGILVEEISKHEKNDHVCEGGSLLNVNNTSKYWGLLQIDINYATEAGNGNPELGLKCLQDCKCNVEYSAIFRAKYLDKNGNKTPSRVLVNFCQWGPYKTILASKLSMYVPDLEDRLRIPICR